MNQFKFSLGPFELFAAIIAGIPLLFASFLLYHPIGGLHDLVPIVKDNSSVAIALTLFFISYILGGTVQGITWRYFAALCKLFNCSYSYFGTLIQDRNQTLPPDAALDFGDRDFEDRLVILLREKVGIPQQSRWVDDRLTAYLQEHHKRSVLSTAELHLATHIMYRTWSFGFALLSVVLVINLFRIPANTPANTFELWLLPFFALLFAYLTFTQALLFKRWNNRGLLLGFYFAASGKV